MISECSVHLGGEHIQEYTADASHCVRKQRRENDTLPLFPFSLRWLPAYGGCYLY